MDLAYLFMVFLGFVFAGVVIKSFQRNTYMFAFLPRLAFVENFEVNGYYVPGSDPTTIEEGSGSYLLINDRLQGYPSNKIAKGPTSQQCYTTDFTRAYERAGSYSQKTNNYKHDYPDSCSSWNHDLVLDFYKSKSS